MIVDFSVHPPLREFLSHFQSDELEGYRDTYPQAGEWARTGDAEKGIVAFLALMDEAGIDVAVVKALDAEATGGDKIPNEAIAALPRAHPDRFVGFAGVDPHKGMRAVKELEHAVTELGLSGLNLQLFENRLAADDRRCYPLYAKCCELGVPANLHTGINFSRLASMEYGLPLALDRVAVDFPELTIVAAPPGWPWVQELLAVAWRHPNVYIGALAVRPKYMARPGTGWEPLLTYGGSLLKERIVFGTSWPLLPLKRSVDEVRALPLPAEVIPLWLGENAARLLGLTASTSGGERG